MTTTLLSSVLTSPWIPTPSDGLTTETLTTQHATETSITTLLSSRPPPTPLLQRSLHITWLTKLLSHVLPPHYVGLDASRPWLIYWTIHSLSLLGVRLDKDSRKRVVDTISSCQNKDGGFGGGPGQKSHLAPSYAAVSAAAVVGEDAWKVIDRQGLYNFLLSMKQPDGSFIMHEGGEVDVRGVYCALTVATLLNTLTPDLAANTSSFVASCQTYEGGLASAAHPFPSTSTLSSLNPPLGEAHGGYAFCAVAGWSLLRAFKKSEVQSKKLDLGNLSRWATGMQAMPIEAGGFRGRTNKLVDGCYSWWNGGLFGVLDALLEDEKVEKDGQVQDELFDRVALQEYVLLAAQSDNGGLRDKPGRHPDAYHTCYNLCGLSSSQNRLRQTKSLIKQFSKDWKDPFTVAKVVEVDQEEEVVIIKGANESDEEAGERMKEVYARAVAWEVVDKIIVGEDSNELIVTHPVLSVPLESGRQMMEHFYAQA